MIHALLHFRFSVVVESAIIRKEEFSQCSYLDIGVCFESSDVEHSSIYSVPELEAIIIMMRSIVNHDSEHYAEEGRSDNTSLFHSVCDQKLF